jgi:hypothetical protein
MSHRWLHTMDELIRYECASCGAVSTSEVTDDCLVVKIGDTLFPLSDYGYHGNQMTCEEAVIRHVQEE